MIVCSTCNREYEPDREHICLGGVVVPASGRPLGAPPQGWGQPQGIPSQGQGQVPPNMVPGNSSSQGFGQPPGFPQQGQMQPQSAQGQRPMQAPPGYPQQGQMPPQGAPNGYPQQGQMPPQGAPTGYPQQGQMPPQGAPGYPQQGQMPPQGAPTGYPQQGQMPPQGAPTGYPQQGQMPPQGAPGYPQQGQMPPQGAPNGYPQQGQMPPQGAPNGYPQQGQMPPQGAPNGYPQQGQMPSQGAPTSYPQQGQMPPQGAPTGYPQQGQMPPQGAPNGYPQQGQMPPQGAPNGYPQQGQMPPQGAPNGYPQQGQMPPQGAPNGFPQQGQGFQQGAPEARPVINPSPWGSQQSMSRQEPHPFIAGSAVSVTVPKNVLPGDGIELAEETLDMRFHVEKPTDTNIGKVIADRYRIRSMVGRGGMGMVYKAEHLNIERMVAIKMLHPHIIADADTIRRFQQEAQAVSRVEHPHSVRIYDFGITEQAQPFLVMDFVDGGSLRQVLREEGTLSMRRTEDIYSQVIQALGAAHDAGIIHKDMKPENIMLCEKSGKPDFVYVVDFGISTLSQSENGHQQAETRGSPGYMSPEQCIKGAEVDHRSDIYSLAISIFETLTGRLPFQASRTFEMIDAHINHTPTPLSAASPAFSACEALTHVLLRAMEKSPDKRQQTAEEFGAELAEAFKRDAIRLNYLKNRKDALLTNSSSMPSFTPQESMPAFPQSERLTEDESREDRNAVSRSGSRKQNKGFVESVVSAITGRTSQEEHEFNPEDAASDSKFTFTNCPRCSEPVDAGIAFCLNCGRSLATTHEFAKLRAAQGVFTLPRSGGESMSSPVPVFSQKTRAAKGGLFGKYKWVLLGVGVGCVVLWFAGGEKMLNQQLSQFNKPPQDTIQTIPPSPQQ